MTALCIDGVYRDGRIELAERPEGVREARVRVTFLPEESPAKERGMVRYAQFSGGPMSTEEDFRAAEWRGEMESGNDG